MLQRISFQDIAGILSWIEAAILLAGSSVMKVLPARIQFLKEQQVTSRFITRITTTKGNVTKRISEAIIGKSLPCQCLYYREVYPTLKMAAKICHALSISAAEILGTQEES